MFGASTNARSESLRIPLVVKVEGGMHARPAAQIAQVAQSFDADIRIESNSGSADAKSMLDILMLAIPCNACITLASTGTDARLAIERLTTLLTSL